MIRRRPKQNQIPLDHIGNAMAKRLLDIVGSVLLLIFCSPLMLVIALGVALGSPGPVIFCQKRVGCGQKTFDLYKFRSMREEPSAEGEKRMTPFGMLIRRTSLDELPQLWNVLKGDMSLVGPRPEIPLYVNRYKKRIPHYKVRHRVKPGITGWAQVHGLRGDTSIEKRTRYDIYYIENWSFALDIGILFLTIGRMRNNEGKTVAASGE